VQWIYVTPRIPWKGIVSEAVKEVVKYGFEVMKLHSIEAVLDPENYGSAKVLEKNGFVKKRI
jgi:ribosomal-protein-alanine N-acetyltransferase